MLAMGERLTVSGERLQADWDSVHMASTLDRTPDERAALALSLNRFASRLAEAGATARDEP